ncbi:alpha/beta fold hydrolase [Simiduia agarivorans]|uniref:Alpha/beta fold family hydrolase n=1 Tax=Simiduia agarivorans (strain DSM 21679 / JCM 13881 / BCRC 17597 / SA1) TaxID=1117647 RepID=K4KH76_SIMAS|nr:alpha/beta fold hydrolase [Simiduia agarivorans]AFU97555.1 alpha/beta fold family hydrolase [Simiduia agarivorans SA1 = DSM 21679]
MTPVDCRFPLRDGRHLAARHWHKPGRPLVLALHGWLDNCASFDKLAPLLDVSLLALDLAGHGHSSHRSPQGPYHIWDDLLDLDQVIAQLPEAPVGLLGHSRGAIISTLYASARPEQVPLLWLIDGIFPEPVEADGTPAQLRKALDEFPRHANRRFAVYDSVAAAASVRQEGMFPVGPDAALALAERGTQQVEQGYSWRADPVLLAPSMLKLTRAQMLSFLQSVRSRGLLIVASEGLPRFFPTVVSSVCELNVIRVEQLDGSHHLHMEAPAAEVAALFNRELEHHLK